MSAELSDEKFEKIVIDQKYLTFSELKKCQTRKRQKKRSLGRVAVELELISQEDLNAIGKIASQKKLTFGGYEVKSILGEGGLGVVYLAKQLTMKRYVALKVLYPQWVKDEEFRKRFLLEARVVGKLSHPNLIQVFDIGFDKGRYFFSMEYVAGRTIEDIVTKNKKIPCRQSIEIAMQVLGALNYIWEKNLVHRDIKPGNIIVTSKKIAKLGDFGFVKCNMENQLGSEDFVLGTPDYMSPEQAMGREDLDYRSDIYSLGASLYHMISGAAPYQGSESMVIRQHIKASIPSPRSIQPDLPEGICFIIEKMMAKLPEDRYNKYEHLKRDLLLVKQGQNPKTQRIESGKSAIARMDDFVGQHPLSRLYQLENELRELKRKENMYRAVIAMLSVLIAILMIAGR